MTQIKRIIGGNEHFHVYGVRSFISNEPDFGTIEVTEFLIFEDNTWIWVDSKFFIPVNIENKKR